MYTHQCYICDRDTQTNDPDPVITEVICDPCVDLEFMNLTISPTIQRETQITEQIVVGFDLRINSDSGFVTHKGEDHV